MRRHFLRRLADDRREKHAHEHRRGFAEKVPDGVKTTLVQAVWAHAHGSTRPFPALPPLKPTFERPVRFELMHSQYSSYVMPLNSVAFRGE